MVEKKVPMARVKRTRNRRERNLGSLSSTVNVLTITIIGKRN